MSDSPAFEQYRYNAPARITLPRLIIGTVIIVFFWMATSLLLLLPSLMGMQGVEQIITSDTGLFAMLATFAGIWIGVWVAVRFIHKDRIANVLAADRTHLPADFIKGFVAVVLTSLLSEVMIYAIRPEFSWASVEFSTWLIVLVPMVLLCFLQTSSEEVLFRGYLLRGLANRFRSPWVWAVIPALCFLAMHYQPTMSASELAVTLLSIGALTVLLVLLVHITGSLGAAMGVHMGNNLMSFLIVGHQDELTDFALFKGAPVSDGLLSTGQNVALVLIGWVCVALTWWLLASRRSPLSVVSRT